MRRATILAIGAVLPLLGGCGAGAFDAADERVTLGRLAAEGAWHACTRDSSTKGPPCTAASRTTEEFDRLAKAARAARQRLDTDSSAAALHEAALLALRVRDSIPTALDDAARFLARARARDTNSATILNDFAVVQLEIGEREQTVRPFLAALDAVEQSLARKPGFRVAMFNRALILDRLYFVSSAHTAWGRYIAAERDEAWKREARGRDSLLAGIADASSLTGGRDETFKVLGEWGRAVMAGDDARATAMLDSARRVLSRVDTLGDQSAWIALKSITGQRSPVLMKRFAAAHMAYSDGIDALDHAKQEAAADLLARAEGELRALGSVVAGWAALYRASAELQLARYDVADTILRRVVADATSGQPALIGKAVSTSGVIAARRGYLEIAISSYRLALPHLARARERYNEGGAYYLLSESLTWAGQHAVGAAEAYRGLQLLAPYRTSNFLNNQLMTVARYARTDHFSFATLDAMDEVLSVGRALGKKDALALAHRTRAHDLFDAGRRDSARTELATAMLTIDSLSGHSWERVRADIQLVQGQLLRRTDPRAALGLLERVVSAYGLLGAEAQSSSAMYETAMAARDAGDTVRSRDWLARAIGQVEKQQTTFLSPEGRAALFETADNAFDAMIDLEVRAGRPDSAFAYLERERSASALTPTRPSSTTSHTVALQAGVSARTAMPEGMVLVEYALLADRAIVWTVSRRRGMSHRVINTPRDTIAALVDRFHREATLATPRTGDARSRLFELLMRPVADELGDASQMSVVGDRELSRLPFAALWDDVTKQYLVERYIVRTVPSAAFLTAALASPRIAAGASSALVVGNPALDSRMSRLGSLPGAESEARRVAKLYTRPKLLTGANARRDTLLALLPTPRVFHFAGHAVFDGDRPELSYLALAPPQSSNTVGGADPSWLTAREIGELRLSNLELVVLSACRTVSSRTSRTGGVAGLASSFLRAGAPAIVSTLWDVSDDATEPLLTAFHELIVAGVPAANALRRAQLAALRARTGQHSAPAAWAGFIYTGP